VVDHIAIDLVYSRVLSCFRLELEAANCWNQLKESWWEREDLDQDWG